MSYPPEIYRNATDSNADGDELMIQCDMCNVWQHGPCVGIWADEEAPDGEDPYVRIIVADFAQSTSVKSANQNTMGR